MSTPITRRSALCTIAGGATVAGIVASLSERLAASESDARLKGRINHSVCKSCYPKASLENLCQAAKGIGITSIDLMAPDHWPTLKKHGLTCAMAKIHEPNLPGAWNQPADHDVLVERFHSVIPQAAAAGLSNIICLSGQSKGMDKQQGLENCATGLKRIMAAAEKHRVTIYLELLNSKVNHKDYMADSTVWGVELVHRVGSERFEAAPPRAANARPAEIGHPSGTQIQYGGAVSSFRRKSCAPVHHEGPARLNGLASLHPPLNP